MVRIIHEHDDGARRPDQRSGDSAVLDDDRHSEVEHPPGTPDDVPYDLTEQTPEQKDEPPVPDLRDERQIAGDQESELWAKQAALRDEDRDTALRLEGLSEEEADRVMELMGEGADEISQGQSQVSTRVGGEPHGGFSEEAYRRKR